MKKTLLKIKNKIVRNVKIALVIWTTVIGFFATILATFLIACGGTLDECQFLGVILLTIFCETCLIAWIAE